MNDARQRYYAALDHESTAQRLFDSQQNRQAGGASRTAYGEEERAAALMGVPAPEDVYSQLGMQVYGALESLLCQVAAKGRGGGGSDGAQVRRAVVDALEPLARDLEGMRNRLERFDALLNEVAAGIRRIDRFTLDAFQRMRAMGIGYGDGGAPRGAGSADAYTRGPDGGLPERAAATDRPSGRLAKEETIARALEAARRLRAQGRKLSLKSVAEAAGLKYSQIVYAFGSKEEMLNQVNRQELDVANAS